MSANIKTCDGICGKFFYEIDLAETCYGQALCYECLMDFTIEQEPGEDDEIFFTNF